MTTAESTPQIRTVSPTEYRHHVQNGAAGPLESLAPTAQHVLSRSGATHWIREYVAGMGMTMIPVKLGDGCTCSTFAIHELAVRQGHDGCYQPKVTPPADPFAGIPGAHRDETEEWF